MRPSKNHLKTKAFQCFMRLGLMIVAILCSIEKTEAQSSRTITADSLGIAVAKPTERLEIGGASPIFFMKPSNWGGQSFARMQLGDKNHFIESVFGRGLIFHDFNGFNFQSPNSYNLGLRSDKWNNKGRLGIEFGDRLTKIEADSLEGFTFSSQEKFKFSGKDNTVMNLRPQVWQPNHFGELRFGNSNHFIRGGHSRIMEFVNDSNFRFEGGTNSHVLMKPSKWNADGDLVELRLGDGNHHIRSTFGKGMRFFDSNRFAFMGSRVGIGTENPSSTLHVSGEQSGNGLNAALTISNTAPGGKSWHLRSGGELSSTPIGGFSIGDDEGLAIAIDGHKRVAIGTSFPHAQLHVKGLANSHVAMFENTNEFSGDGIAIKLHEKDNQTDSNNRFVSFLKGNNSVAGRIQGFQYNQSEVSNLIQGLIEVMGIDKNKNPVFGELTSLNINTTRDALNEILDPKPAVFRTPSFNPGSLVPPRLPSIQWNDLANPQIFSNKIIEMALTPYADIKTAGHGIIDVEAFKQRLKDNPNVTRQLLTNRAAIRSLVTSGDPWGIALSAMAIEAFAFLNDDGVTYVSTGADYAEWLPKQDTTEILKWGQIVGVKNGKISKNTNDADQIMVVFNNPIVLGNMVPKDQEVFHEKVGFMGQVPVYVRGKVKTGDYILASGLNDGVGRAVSPNKIRLQDFRSILGRAWSDSQTSFGGIVKVAIGLKTNEWVQLLETHQQRLDELETELAQANSGQKVLQEVIDQVVLDLNTLKQQMDKTNTVHASVREQ